MQEVSFKDEYYLDNMVLGMKIYNYLHRYGVNGKISGNLACIGEIKDAAVVLYGPRGCGFHYRYHARSRYSPVYKLECADLHDRDVIFGAEDKLRELLCEIERVQAPKLIFVLPSVVSDVLNDDMQGFVQSLQSYFKAKLVPVASQAFSHMNKSNSRKVLKEMAGQSLRKKFSSSAVYPGCGYVEVMDALVEQVMEPQEAEPLSVNIETFAWGYNGQLKLRGLADMLAKIGIKVNAFLPAADIESIRQAPRAALNIVRRKKWAMAMQQRFGTPFLHIADMQEWHGLDGIEDFYKDIGRILGCSKKAEQVLSEERAKIAGRYACLRELFAKHSFCLITQGLASLPNAIRTYQHDYGLPINSICLIMNPAYKAETGLDDAMLAKFREKAEDAKRMYGCKATVIIDPDDAALAKAAEGSDFIICNSNPLYAALGKPIVCGMLDRSIWTYEGFIAIMEEINAKLEKPLAMGKKLLLSKLSYDNVFYPLRSDDDDSRASREMFSKLWRQRGL